MSNQQEKRQYPRAAVTWSVVLRTARGEIRCETANITVAGALILCEEPLRAKEAIEIVLDVPSLIRPIILTAEVVHTHISDPEDEMSPCQIGVRFTEISDKNRWLISTAVQRESGAMLMP